MAGTAPSEFQGNDPLAQRAHDPMKKTSLGIFFGGRSCEHEVSVRSARSILKAIDRNRYQVHLVGIDKGGRWHLSDDLDKITHSGAVEPFAGDPAASTSVSMALHHQGNLTGPAKGTGLAERDRPSVPALDVIFPVLHGTFGEDGTLQGVLEMAGIPYVGCGVAASALAMDKALSKKVFEANGIPQARYAVLTLFDWRENRHLALSTTEQLLGYPVFAKPANLGSSVGISKAKNRDELTRAIRTAFEFDNKIVLEESMENCLEIECSVLGNQDPEASVPGEIIPGAEFYNYETKYLDDKSRLVIPAPLDRQATERVQSLALAAFRAIDGSGLARVDFFVHRETGEITLNEVNTLPGFTPISMYPQLWAASGVPYAELINRLIQLALERHHSRQSIKRIF